MFGIVIFGSTNGFGDDCSFRCCHHGEAEQQRYDEADYWFHRGHPFFVLMWLLYHFRGRESFFYIILVDNAITRLSNEGIVNVTVTVPVFVP